mgnify:FL=1
MKNNFVNNKTLTMENLNPRVIEVEYAVRGPIVLRAAEIEKEIKSVDEFCFYFFVSKIKTYFFFFSFSRVNTVFHLNVSFEQILVIVMQAVIKNRLHIFVRLVFHLFVCLIFKLMCFKLVRCRLHTSDSYEFAGFSC